MCGMTYLLLKTVHLYSLALFAGSIVTVSALAALAERGRDTAMLQTAFRLNRYLVTPVFITAFFAGIALAWHGGWYTQPWLIAKFAIVFIMGGVHGSFSGRLRKRAEGALEPQASDSSYFGGMAAAFALFLAAIVSLAVFKPGLGF